MRFRLLHLNRHGDKSVTNDGPLGVLEVLPGGSGFIRRREVSYTPGKDDIYVGARVIQKFDLRTGDELLGEVGKRPNNGKSAPLRHLRLVNGVPPEEVPRRPLFSQLGAQHPDEPLIAGMRADARGRPDAHQPGHRPVLSPRARGSGP